ncbi:MAG: hypothetical protein DRP51_02235 [Candidatus Zixiibacteriota bacterium]|nr:MAG: hypothetical protein DRP51_02235 [candidate division Zixibacteria bacterium]
MQVYSRMKKGRLIAVTISVLAMLSGASTVTAQDVAVGQATATVLTVLTVTAPQDLAFGNVLQGVPTTIARTNATNAGIFQIAGEGAANQEVSMHMQLPDYLWNSGAGVQDRLVIAFSATDCTVDTTNGTPDAPGLGAVVGTDPQNLTDIGIGGDDGVIRIYLGGTVHPTPDQRAGSYSADIILTAAYTGD